MTDGTGSRRGPDIEGLAAFAERGDRDDALFFVGRKREISTVERLCAQALEASRPGLGARGRRGLTRLVQGAPGAGKSALLAELTRRWTAAVFGAAGKGGPGSLLSTPLPVELEWDELLSEEAVARHILRASDAQAEERSRRTQTKGVSGGISAGPFRAAFRMGGSTAPGTLSFARLRELAPEGGWTRPVCLLVDEIQQAHAGVLPVLNKLHQGRHGLPLVPVLAGLGSAQAHLGRIGLTRLSGGAVHSIGCLAPEEACEAVERMLDAYGVDREDGNREWSEWLAARSDGWPQHLHNGMTALAAELVRTGGRLAAVDGDAVAALEEHRRAQTYIARLSPELRGAACLVGAVMVAIGAGGTRAAVFNAIADHARSDRVEWSLPDGMNRVDFLCHLVQRGVLHCDPESDLYCCPIPSFRAYLVERGRVAANRDRSPSDPPG